MIRRKDAGTIRLMRVCMKDFDGMSVSDYAKHMGISQSAVSQQLKTIYKKLKKFL